jgi:hypothetical protein
MTARDIAERVLVAANIKRPDKAALADLIGTVLASLRNHDGKGVQRANDGSPAKWRLAQLRKNLAVEGVPGEVSLIMRAAENWCAGGVCDLKLTKN